MAPPVVPRQYTIERRQGVVVGTGAELEDGDPGRRMWHEHGQQAVTAGSVLGDEPPAGIGQIREAALAARRDGELERVYGKIERSASRMRPSPPIAGADS